jgi:lambda family phage portal protein
MAKRKTTAKRAAKRPTALRSAELPEERQLRRLMLKARVVQAKQMLASYAAADKGRRNKDWKASGASADLAILPDAAMLNARARAMVRDSWVAKAAVRSVQRNVVGRGITPVPTAKSAGGTASAGTELKGLNDAAEKLFWQWASDPKLCDIERRQTFWQKQAMCVGERWTTGEHFIVWSYVGGDGENVGLRLQSFEPEQLDQRVLSYGNNQVRGGIEVDAETGEAVAYHFYARNPSDYVARIPTQFKSQRFSRDRVLHYFKQERVLQTRGVTEFAPVLQRIRDFHRRDEAEMFAAIMEACIGLIVTKNTPTGTGYLPTMPLAPGDTGQTTSGMRTADFVPGMFFEAQPGEDVKPFSPSRPGGTYEPFARQQLRGIGAGTGLSYEQISRDFSQGTYSSQRQGMLEDYREWRPEADLLTDLVICPIYELFMKFAVLEGRLPLSLEKFITNPKQYSAAEYVPDGHEWIDPLKEVTAIEKAIQLRLTTRKQEIAARGGRLRSTFEEIKAEQDLAGSLNITLPEDVTAKSALMPTTPPPDENNGDQNNAGN